MRLGGPRAYLAPIVLATRLAQGDVLPDGRRTTDAASADATTGKRATSGRRADSVTHRGEHDDAKDDGVVWRPEWDRFRLWQYIATPIAIGASVYIAFGIGYPDKDIVGPWLFDSSVRDVFAADSRSGRDRGRYVADVSWRVLTVYPVLVEPSIALVGHGSSDVATQMLLINLQSMSWTALASLVPEKVLPRGRPSKEPCAADPDYEAFCGFEDQNASFPSGHTSVATTGAALMCVHGEHLPLYGGGVGERIACYTGILGAAATGLGRLVNDRHYSTDVLAGWAIGFVSGYVVPKWLHYGFSSQGGRVEHARSHLAVTPMVDTDTLGVSFTAVH